MPAVGILTWGLVRGLEEVSAEVDEEGLAEANGLTADEKGAGWLENEVVVVPKEPQEDDGLPKTLDAGWEGRKGECF